MAETKARLYKRSTVEKKLKELLKRVEVLNSGQGFTDGLVYCVKKLVVFGSYLDESKDKVHDLDIGFELVLKDKFKDTSLPELAKMRESEMPEQFRRDSYGIYQLIWLQEEVLRFLKNRSGIYSFHPLEDKNEHKLIMGSKHKVVYDINKDGEKDRLRALFEEEQAKLSSVFG